MVQDLGFGHVVGCFPDCGERFRDLLFMVGASDWRGLLVSGLTEKFYEALLA